ncbi:MAG: hypothetical protein C0200_00640, partial [Thermoproteota archaeon]
ETAYVTITLRDQAGNKVFSGTASKTATGVFSLTIPPDVTKNLAAGAYTIEAFVAKEAGLAFGMTSSVQLIVKAAPPPPPPPTAKAAPPTIEYFKAEPSTIQVGQSSTISWSVKNATSVKLNGEEVPATGTKTVSPSTNTTYTLVASNEAGTVSKSLTISVVSPPPPPPPPAGPSPALIGGVIVVIIIIAVLAWYLLKKK